MIDKRPNHLTTLSFYKLFVYLNDIMMIIMNKGWVHLNTSEKVWTCQKKFETSFLINLTDELISTFGNGTSTCYKKSETLASYFIHS